MKFFKSSILATVALMGAAFTACSDDNEYVPAASVDGVYFTTDDLAEVSVDPEDTGFTVQIGRSGSTAAATYNLESSLSEAAQGKFTIPSTVTFAEGEKLANITVGCALTPDDLEQSYAMSITFANETPLYPWGYSDYEFSVKVIARDPLKYWKPVGYATIIDPWIMSRFYTMFSDNSTLEDLAWSAPLYESLTRPGRYYIEDLWTDPDGYMAMFAEVGQVELLQSTNIYIDCTNEQCVKIEPQGSGVAMELNEGSMSELFIGNIAGLYAANGLSDEEILERGVESTIEDGFIYIYPALIGFDGEFGYQWNDNPEGAILLEYEDVPSGVAQKKSALSLSMQNGKVNLSKYVKFAKVYNR